MNEIKDSQSPEELHSHVDAVIPNIQTGGMSYHHRESIKAAVENPHFNQEHFNKLFTASLSNTSGGTFDSNYNEPDTMSLLSKHPLFTKEHADKFLSAKDVHENDQFTISDISHKSDPSIFENIVNNHIEGNDGTNDQYSIREDYGDGNLSDAYVKHLIATRQQDPQTEEEKLKAKKIDCIVNKHLINKEHSPESLQETFDYMTSPQFKKQSSTTRYDRDYEDNTSKALSEFTKKQDNLSKDHLNKLWEIATANSSDASSHRSNYSRDVKSAIIKHNNVDPILLAKVAKGDSDFADDALANPRLPKEVIKSVLLGKINTKKEDLIHNPALSTLDVKTLIKEGHKRALSHENVDPQDIQEYWDKSDKSSDVAEDMLRLEKVPAGVLSDIVNHKNQKLAIQALKHENANESVVETGLKRKAAEVRLAATKHPLVADREIKKSLLENKIPFSKFSSTKDFKQKFESFSPEEKMNVYKHFGKQLENEDEDKLTSFLKIEPHEIITHQTDYILSPYADPESKAKITNKVLSKIEKSFPANQEVSASGNDFKRHNHRALERLLEVGNKDAEQIALDRPHSITDMIQNVENLGSDFLTKAFHAVESHSGQYFTSNGYPREMTFEDKQGDMLDIASHPAFDNNKFIEFYKQSIQNPLTTSNTLFSGNQGNLFDNKYGDLPDDERQAAFAKLQANGLHKEVVTASKSTKEMASESFKQLPPNQLNNLALQRSFKFEDKATPELIDLALRDKFRLNESNDRYAPTPNFYQKAAIETLDSTQESHKDMMVKLLSGQYGETLTSKNISEIMDRSWFSNQPDFIMQHSQNRLTVYQKASEGKVNQITSKYFKKDSDKDAYLANEVNTVKAMADNYSINNPHISEDLKKDAAIEFWGNLIDEGKLKHFTGQNYGSLPSNGRLDFLSETAKGDKKFLGKLIGSNLLSNEMREHLINTEVDFHEAFKATNDGPRRADMANKHIAKVLSMTDKAKAGDELYAMFKHVPNKLMIGTYGTKSSSWNEEQVNSISDRVLAFAKLPAVQFNQVLQSTLFPIAGSESFTKDGLKKAVKSLATKISNDPELSLKDKSHMISALQDKSESKNIPLKGFAEGIINQAVKEKDIGALVQFISGADEVSPKIQKTIADLAKDPTKLTLEQSSDLLRHSGVLKFDNSFRKTLFNTNEHKINQAFESGAVDVDKYTELTTEMLENVVSFSSDWGNYSASILEKYAKNGVQEVRKYSNTRLWSSLKESSTVDEESKVRIFKNLPLNETNFSKTIELSSEMLNNPEVIEAAQGPKLENIIEVTENLQKIKPDLADVLLSRHMEGERYLQHDEYKKSIFRKIIGMQNISSEMKTRATRSLPAMALVGHLLSDNTNYYSQGLKEIGSSLSERMDALNAKISAYEGKLGEPSKEDVMDFANHTLGVGQLIRHLAFNEDAADKKEKQDIVESLINKSTTFYSNLISKSPQDEGKKNLAVDLFKNITATGLALSSKSVYDLNNIFQKTKANPSTVEAYRSMVKKAEGLQEEDWKMLNDQNPETILHLGERSSVDSTMLSSLKHDDALNISPKMTFNAMAKIFTKMDHDALQQYGKEFVNKYSNYAAADENLKETEEVSTFMRASLSQAGSFLQYEDLQPIMKTGMVSTAIQADMLKAGVGGEKFSEDFYQKEIENRDDEIFTKAMLSYYLQSQNIPEKRQSEIVDKFITNLNERQTGDLENLHTIVKNPKFNEKNIDKVADFILSNHKNNYRSIDTRQSTKLAMALFAAPNLSYETLENLYKETEEKDQDALFAHSSQFHPAFTNPMHGAKLLREVPAKVPKSLNAMGLDAGKLVTRIKATSKGAQKVSEVMAALPPEGIMWADFKKKYPKYESNADVKKVFMARNNKPVMPEDLIPVIKEMDEKDAFNEYHLTVAHWDSELQTHTRKKTNAVFQINASQKINQELGKDPKVWGLYQMVLKNTNGIKDNSIGMHPTTPQCVGWSRIDVSNKDAWIIEEFQSDVAQKFRKNLRSLLQNSPAGLKINGDTITPNEIKAAAIKIDKSLENWQDAAMNSVLENAKAHGISKIYLHGSGVRSELSGADASGWYGKDNMNPRLVEMYDGNGEKYGFSKCDYTDYPNSKPEMAKAVEAKGMSTKCWVLDVNSKKKA